MTGLQIAIAGGALVGLGLVVLVYGFLPAHPDLGDLLRRYQTSATAQSASAPVVPTLTGDAEVGDQLGLWAMRRLPPRWWGATPTRELALLQTPLHRHYGRKVTFAVLGLLIPPVMTAFFHLLGLPLPFYVPAIASIGLAILLWIIPDVDARADAKKARYEFSRALSSYVDLVALERLAGAGPRQAMERAAEVGDTWVFQRIREELARSQWSGLAPWEALHALSEELGLAELEELADTLSYTREGSQVYDMLRARSTAMRSAQHSDELTRANEVNEKMTIPMSLTGVVFMVILIGPALLRVFFGDTA